MTQGNVDGRLAWVSNVSVGTQNLPKLEAVRSAFSAYGGEVEVSGHGVASQVSEQPVGFGEIVAGARNRARAAGARGPCDLSVGLEDGLIEVPELSGEVLNVGAAIVTDGVREGLGFSSAFAYPPHCVEEALISREPIGGLFDTLWRDESGEEGDAPSALSVGNIGKLSLGVLPRSEYGRHAVLCALVGFLHPALYAHSASRGPGESAGRISGGRDLE